MKIGEYLKIGEKIKAARIKTGLSQKEMAKRLGLGTSAYSNYENSYSEPSVEIMENFCKEAGITLPELLELDISSHERPEIRTFSDFLQDILDLRNIGLPLSVNFRSKEGSLFGDFSFENPQMATLATSLQKDLEMLQSGKLDEEEFETRANNLLKMFNIPVSDYVD